ncbi:MAG: hypothetical protein FWD17_12410 [Polyangiaceae bacterium]|nr:hypothetical protein [Polyangiaceae bacterium]
MNLAGRLVAAAIAAIVLLVPRVARAEAAPTFADRDGPSAGVDASDRSFALFVSPFAMAYGRLGAEGDWVVAHGIVAAVDAAAVRAPSWADGRSGAALGLAAHAYPLGSAFHALALSARLGVVRSLRDPPFRVNPHVDAAELALSAGWHWTWDYGLSVRVGAGPLVAVGGRLPPMSPELLAGPVRVSLWGDASVGWAF